jgi:hypothetical protein
VRKLAGAFHFQ